MALVVPDLLHTLSGRPMLESLHLRVSERTLFPALDALGLRRDTYLLGGQYLLSLRFI